MQQATVGALQLPAAAAAAVAMQQYSMPDCTDQASHARRECAMCRALTHAASTSSSILLQGSDMSGKAASKRRPVSDLLISRRGVQLHIGQRAGVPVAMESWRAGPQPSRPGLCAQPSARIPGLLPWLRICMAARTCCCMPALNHSCHQPRACPLNTQLRRQGSFCMTAVASAPGSAHVECKGGTRLPASAGAKVCRSSRSGGPGRQHVERLRCWCQLLYEPGQTWQHSSDSSG